MGERRKDALRGASAEKVKLKVYGTKVTNDAGRLAVDSAMRRLLVRRFMFIWKMNTYGMLSDWPLMMSFVNK